MADPCIAPGDNSHTCRGLSPYRGGLGGHSKLAPLLSRGLYPKRQRKSSMRFKTSFYKVAELQFLQNTFDVFARKRENTSTHYRTSYLVTSTCTSYPFTHHHPTSTTTSGGVNGVKTLADRTVLFQTDGRSLYIAPGDNSHTCRGLSP